MHYTMQSNFYIWNKQIIVIACVNRRVPFKHNFQFLHFRRRLSVLFKCFTHGCIYKVQQCVAYVGQRSHDVSSLEFLAFSYNALKLLGWHEDFRFHPT